MSSIILSICSLDVFLKKLENADVKISRATFFRCWQSYILPVSFTAKRSCLCIKYQNITLMIKPLKVVHGSEIRNIDNFFKNTSNEQIDKMIDDINNEKMWHDLF
jgi:hypothetical protein